MFGAGAVVICSPSVAEMSSPNYALPSHAVSSGGEEEMSSPNYKLQDIKGQGVIGAGSSTNYGGELGVIYTLLPEGPMGWLEDPHVRNLRIRRSGADIIVEWDAEPTTFAGPFYVYRKLGAFENDVAGWSSGIDNGSSTAYTDAGQVGAGDEQIYYRVLSVSDKSRLIYKVAVGKVNAALDASGLKLVTCPFNDGIVSAVFPPQMAGGQQYKLYPRAGNGLDVVTVNASGVTGQDFAVSPTAGFWMRNESSDTSGSPIAAAVTFCGSLEVPFQKDLATLDLTGNPLPWSLGSAVLGGEPGDIFYHQAGRGLNPVVKTSGGWTAYSFSVGEGMWYRTYSHERYWDVDILNEQAEIKSRPVP